jgi:hypothetical protein
VTTLHYDLDNPQQGIRECPKCRFTMQYLCRSAFLNRNEGYILDRGVGFDPDDHILTSLLLGSWRRFLWRHFIEPLSYQFFGQWRCRYYRRVARRHPGTLICPHCRYLIRQQ